MGELAQAHLSEDALEEYALGRLSGDELDRLEEHLLVCPECQDQLSATENFIDSIQTALRRLERREVDQGKAKSNWFTMLTLVPNLAWAGALAVLAVWLVLWFPRSAGSGAYPVRLVAMRGPGDSFASAPVGKPYLLQADLTGLAPARQFRVEITSTTGAAVWVSTADPRGGTLEVPVRQRLSAGRYWVRLYEPAGTVVREYGLEVR